MCPRNSAPAMAMLLLLAFAAPGVCRATDADVARRAADLAVDDYLDANGLLDLRAAHLERLIAQSPERDSGEIAGRLARVYALLMESAENEEVRLAFEAKCEALLGQAPQADTLDLRLSLARARYVRTEQVAERFRLGLASAHEAQAARTVFSELAPIFDALAERADARVRELERQLEAGAPRDELMTSAVGGSRRVRSMSRFLGGWSAYYMAELDITGRDAAGIAQAAQVRFGALLEAKKGNVPSRDRVAPDMLRFDHVARAALGVGLAWSLRGNLDEALEWIDLVDAAPQTDAGVRSQVPARRIIVLARAQEWGRLASYVDRIAKPSVEGGAALHALTTADARLLASLALTRDDQAPRAPQARLLIARQALGALIRSGHGAQSLEYIEAFLELIAPDERASSGFLPRYLRALREYDAARASHRATARSGGDAPAREKEARRRFAAAESFVDGALSAFDAEDFVDVRPQALLIGALSAFFAAEGAARLDRACDRLLEAATALEQTVPDQAASARRLAIRAMDLAIEASNAGASGPYKERRRALIEAFIAWRPEDPAAGAYAYQRATAGELAGEQSIESLLLVDGSEELRTAARHEVGRLLYQRFLGADESSKAIEARRFLSHASTLLEEDRKRLVTGDEEAFAATLMNARRTLDCALWLAPSESEIAIRAYDLMASLDLRGAIPEGAVQAEFRFRAIQIALLRNDVQTAEAETDALCQMDAALAHSARRELYRHALDQWSAGNSLEDARRVVRHGREVLRRLPALNDGAPDPVTIAVSAGVARAAASIWAATGEEEARELATLLYRMALRADPRNRTLLESAATFYDQCNDAPAALEAWRSLLSGLTAGSDNWFKVKVRVVAILVELEPVRARQVLDQHRMLYPHMGPAPWGEQLEALDMRSRSAGASGDGGA